MTKIEGGCLCRAVRYAVRGEPLAALACHCRDCQYLSGGAEANVILVPRPALTLLSGELRTFRSTAAAGFAVWRSFCPVCGTPLLSGTASHPDVVAINVGTLDDPSGFRRRGHIWTVSAQPWHLMEPDLPRSAGNPDFI